MMVVGSRPVATVLRAIPGSLAYLVGYYPAVSHTFITREVDGLRARGMAVHTVSLRAAPAQSLLTDADHRAARETFVVQSAGVARIAGAQLRALRRMPRRYVRTLRAAVGSSAGGARNGVWQLFYFAEAVVLHEELERRGVRHVHAHFANAASAVAMLTATLGQRDGMTWSFTMHGPTEFDDITRYGLAEKVERARFVICIGDFCRSQLMRLVGADAWSRLEVVRCGVDLERFVPGLRPDRGRRLDVLCVGRLVADKGQAILLDAVARLRGEGRDVRLVLAGDGPDREPLERLAGRLGLGDAVRFLGAVDQERLRGLYAHADVFCLPSFAEGIPVVLMEAMACGLPVVSTAVAGIPELVEDARSGRVVAPGRADVLADALRELQDDPAQRLALGEGARATVEARYDLEASISALELRFGPVVA